jgi:hypothetical protein
MRAAPSPRVTTPIGDVIRRIGTFDTTMWASRLAAIVARVIGSGDSRVLNHRRVVAGAFADSANGG